MSYSCVLRNQKIAINFKKVLQGLGGVTYIHTYCRVICDCGQTQSHDLLQIGAERYCHFSITIDTLLNIHDVILRALKFYSNLPFSYKVYNTPLFSSFYVFLMYLSFLVKFFHISIFNLLVSITQQHQQFQPHHINETPSMCIINYYFDLF